MRIEKKRVKNIESYLKHIPKGEKIRIVFGIENKDDYKKVGYSSQPAAGETILPKIVGPVSRYNSNGKWKSLKTIPKERRYIHTIMWRWTTWNGEENEKPVDIYRLCYQRTLESPPSVELTLVEKDNKQYFFSKSLEYPSTNDDKLYLLHTVNLFLELFGSCQILTNSLNVPNIKIKRVNWEILPPGKQPWERVEAHIKSISLGKKIGTREIILERQKFITSQKPDEIWKGIGGFNDYLAYVFLQKKMVVLESIRHGNAIYVFGLDWQDVSKLSKAEVLQDNLQKERIIHAKGWKNKLKTLLN